MNLEFEHFLRDAKILVREISEKDSMTPFITKSLRHRLLKTKIAKHLKEP